MHPSALPGPDNVEAMVPRLVPRECVWEGTSLCAHPTCPTRSPVVHSRMIHIGTSCIPRTGVLPVDGDAQWDPHWRGGRLVSDSPRSVGMM